MRSHSVEYRLSVANLPLQMTLYYNCSFSLLFVILMFSAVIDKVRSIETKITMVDNIVLLMY
jgi:hypothetical protein